MSNPTMCRRFRQSRFGVDMRGSTQGSDSATMEAQNPTFESRIVSRTILKNKRALRVLRPEPVGFADHLDSHVGEPSVVGNAMCLEVC